MLTKSNLPLLLSLLLSLFSLSLSKSLQYNSFIPAGLSSTPTHSQALDDSLSLDQTEDTNIETNTLSLQLHHLDSLSKPNASTPSELFTLRLQRDASRVKSISSLVARKSNLTAGDFTSSVVSGLAYGSGEYFTRLGVGTPPKYSYMVLDTGSDLVWLQCKPCLKCYSQSDPVFDPTQSTSFVGIGCGSPLCKKLDARGCSKKKKCLYQVQYGDGSFTVGRFATETLSFRKGNKVNNIAVGCGQDNEGLFVGAAGLLGLGRGELSFPSQAGPKFGSKFSYCLNDRSASSKPSSIVFGESAISKTAVFTPLKTNPKFDTFYYIDLVGISVGGERLRAVLPSLFKTDVSGNGGVILDSGTSVTRLTRPAYTALRDAFRAGATHLKTAPNFSLFDTCFDLSGQSEVKVPTVVMHFTGADVSFPASNYLIPVDSSGTFCFAFAGTNNGLSIIGNIQQQGIRVIYDLAGSRIGFAPRGCA
ncbi:hypothetical protein ACET3Z_005350 [Daucus carota]